jgi:FkbM family methyltransferase|tara:strand:+ start:114 stop:836 length:723 start_codon:yes stop_codon:yes gene_type:complete
MIYFLRKIYLFFDYFNQKKILKYLANFFKDKKINNVFDVGAHHGETVEFILKNFEIEKIYTFEPSPINYKILLNNLKNKSKNDVIKTFNIALGEKNKTSKLNQVIESSSSTLNELNINSKYYKRKFKILNLLKLKKDFNPIDVEQIRSEDFVNKQNIENIDILKIDTEGFEYYVIKGFGDFIRNIKVIWFEHHYDMMIKKGYTFSDINDYLIQNNFSKAHKTKMYFRKSFEYIYIKKDLN